METTNKTKRAPRTTKPTATAMFSYDVIDNGKLLHIEKPVVSVSMDTLLTHTRNDAVIDDALIGHLFTGNAFVYANGSAFVKAVNEKAKAEKSKTRVSKNDVKAVYDKLQAYARIIELAGTKALQSAWDTFTVEKIAEREQVKKDNAVLVANGENPKPLPRIAKPSVNGILAMLKPKAEVDHLQAFIKSAKTAYNHLLECKGKQAQQDAEKLAALIVSNGGEV